MLHLDLNFCMRILNASQSWRKHSKFMHVLHGLINLFYYHFYIIFYTVCFDLKENVVRCQLACYSVSAHVLSDLVLNFGIHILCTCLQLQVKLVQVLQGLQLVQLQVCFFFLSFFLFNLSTLLFRRYCRSTSVTV